MHVRVRVINGSQSIDPRQDFTQVLKWADKVNAKEVDTKKKGYGGEKEAGVAIGILTAKNIT